MADTVNTGMPPPPIQTDITGVNGDQFGVPYQLRDQPATGSLNVIWASWFNALNATLYAAHVTSLSTDSVVLTAAFQLISGLSLKLTKVGWWSIRVYLMVSSDYRDTDQLAELKFSGIVQPGLIDVSTSVGNNATNIITAYEWWVRSTSGSETCEIWGRKLAGGGNSAMGSSGSGAGQSMLVANWEHY